jgi:NitT/TauT family transport system substrate-binding protein
VGGAAGPRAQPRQQVTIAVQQLVDSGLLLVADAEGFFRNSGLTVKLTHFSTGNLTIESMTRGEAQFAVSATTPIVLSVLQGRRITVVSSVFRSSSDLMIVARRDRGIASVSDLRGKRLGTTFGTALEYFAHVVLTVAGVPSREVTLVNLPYSSLPAALLAARLDAVTLGLPVAEQMSDTLGRDAITFSAVGLYATTDSLVTTQSFAAAHEDLIRALLRALAKAQTFILEHPQATRDALARDLRYDPRLLDRVWGELQYGIGLDQGVLVNMEQQAGWMIGSGIVRRQSVPDFLENIDSIALRSVAPDTITMPP